MKTVISVKVDEDVKKNAQAVAKTFGIPLSTLINAYLIELSVTKQVHFNAVEMMTPKLEKIIEQAEKDIKNGDTAGPFYDVDDAISYLNSL